MTNHLISGVMALLAMSLPQAVLVAQNAVRNDPAQASSATLDRMIAEGKGPRELAGYVFKTHGCKTCHTAGRDGKLGFTEMGKQKAKGYEGCISMLTAMTVIVQVPEDERRPEQRQKAARFEEFGCTACHKITPGKMDLTEVGAKLTHLHLGCVDVEKVMARKTSESKP